LKSTGAQAPWGFESLALRHFSKYLRSVCFAVFCFGEPAVPVIVPVPISAPVAVGFGDGHCWLLTEDDPPAGNVAGPPLAYC